MDRQKRQETDDCKKNPSHIILFNPFLSVDNVHAFRQLLPDDIEVAQGDASYLLAAEGMDNHLLALICQEEDVKHICRSVVAAENLTALLSPCALNCKYLYLHIFLNFAGKAGFFTPSFIPPLLGAFPKPLPGGYS